MKTKTKMRISGKASLRVAFDHLNTSFENSWLPEFLALGLSLASTSVIIGLLFAYDGEGLARWRFPGKISLNAVISTFSTISKGFLAVAVSATIGQWKWLSFRPTKRTLESFDALDKSSRGPWGSAQVLIAPKVR